MKDHNTFYLIKEEKDMQSDLLYSFKTDFNRLQLVLEFQNILYSDYLCNEINKKIDIMMTNISKMVNIEFDKNIVSCYLLDIYFDVINCSFLNFKDFFLQLYDIAKCILKNSEIINPMSEYFNELFSKFINEFSIKRTSQIDYTEIYEKYNLSEESKWLAIQIYNEFWKLFVSNNCSEEIEKLNTEHTQSIIEMSNNFNKRPLNQTTADIKRYIEYFENVTKKQSQSDEFRKSLATARIDNIQNKENQEMELLMKHKQVKPSAKHKKNYIFCAIIGGVLSSLYLLGIADFDYSYYQFVRVFSFIFIPIFLYSFWKIEKIDDSLDVMLLYIPSVIVWMLFNPIFPFYMSKENWIIFDVICAMVFLIINIFLIFLYRYNKK